LRRLEGVSCPLLFIAGSSTANRSSSITCGRKEGNSKIGVSVWEIVELIRTRNLAGQHSNFGAQIDLMAPKHNVYHTINNIPHMHKVGGVIVKRRECTRTHNKDLWEALQLWFR
jgi:hypothetical protein